MQYMEQENSTSLVQFWLTAESFRSQISDTVHVPDIERDTADAIAIYERCEVAVINSCQHVYYGSLDLLHVHLSASYF